MAGNTFCDDVDDGDLWVVVHWVHLFEIELANIKKRSGFGEDQVCWQCESV